MSDLIALKSAPGFFIKAETRHSDAIHIQGGASNALAVANTLVSAIREARAAGKAWNCTDDAATRLIAHQLAYLLNVHALDDLRAYDAAMRECEVAK